MLKIKKFLILLAIIMLFSIFAGVGCKDSAYDATLYDNKFDWIKREFRINNPIKKKEDKNTYIVDNQQTYDSMFVENIAELDVDFSSQMIVVYHIWGTDKKEVSLVDVQVKNDVLKIICKKGYFGEKHDTTCVEYQRVFVVKMDKVDVKEVSFVEKYYAVVK